MLDCVVTSLTSKSKEKKAVKEESKYFKIHTIKTTLSNSVRLNFSISVKKTK